MRYPKPVGREGFTAEQLREGQRLYCSNIAAGRPGYEGMTEEQREWRREYIRLTGIKFRAEHGRKRATPRQKTEQFHRALTRGAGEPT